MRQHCCNYRITKIKSTVSLQILTTTVVYCATVNVAVAKARTANNFKRPTKVFEEGVSGGRNVILSLPDALPIEGGLPIVVDNKIVGAIGVSGATSQQDGQIAEAGLASLKAK